MGQRKSSGTAQNVLELIKSYPDLMVQLLYVCTNVAPWTNESAAHLDMCLQNMGATPLHIDCSDLALEDGEHFTWNGFKHFVMRLMQSLRPHLSKGWRIQMYSDSTVDYHNYNEDYSHRHFVADTHLKSVFAKVSTQLLVDAVCGSGFVASVGSGEHFHARLSRDWRAGMLKNVDAILIIGGWNDVCASPQALCNAVLGVARLWRLIDEDDSECVHENRKRLT